MKYLHWMAIGLLMWTVGCAPMTYRNEYLSPNKPMADYPRVTLATSGFFADQVGLSLKNKLASKGLMSHGGDLTLMISSRLELYPRKEGFFKMNARPAITTLTMQAVRNSDQEIVYSLVKQYTVTIDRKYGAVTEGWVDMAANELANELAKNVFNP